MSGETPTAWVTIIRRHMVEDPDFRRAFERTPGKAALSIGVPAPDLADLFARMSEPKIEETEQLELPP